MITSAFFAVREVREPSQGGETAVLALALRRLTLAKPEGLNDLVHCLRLAPVAPLIFPRFGGRG